MLSTEERYKKIKDYLMAQQSPGDLDRLQEEEALATDARTVAGLGSGFDKIISAIGGTQANPEPYNTMQKYASEGATRVKDYLKQKYDSQKALEGRAVELAKADVQNETNEAQRQFTNQLAKDNLALKKEHEAREAAKGDVGQQAMAKSEADIVANWDVGGGRQRYAAALSRLQGIKNDLDAMPESATDKIRGRMGDFALSEKQLKIKQDVLNAALPILKETFGAQLSEGERQALASSFYDPKLPPKVNAKNIETKIAEAMSNAAEKEAITSRFKGSRGMQSPTQQSAPSQYSQQQEAGIKRVMDQNDISREEAIRALKGANKLP